MPSHNSRGTVPKLCDRRWTLLSVLLGSLFYHHRLLWMRSTTNQSDKENVDQGLINVIKHKYASSYNSIILEHHCHKKIGIMLMSDLTVSDFIKKNDTKCISINVCPVSCSWQSEFLKIVFGVLYWNYDKRLWLLYRARTLSFEVKSNLPMPVQTEQV